MGTGFSITVVASGLIRRCYSLHPVRMKTTGHATGGAHSQLEFVEFRKKKKRILY